jgi:hypothetical protein
MLRDPELAGLVSALAFEPIIDAIDREHVPRVHLNHLFFRVVGHEPFECNLAISCTDPNPAGVDQRVLLKDQLYGLRDLVVAIFLNGRYFEAIDHIAATRHPPCEHPGESLLGEATYLAVEGNYPVSNGEVDRTRWRRCHLLEDPPAATLFGPDAALIERGFFDESIAHMITNLPVTHWPRRRYSQAINDRIDSGDRRRMP